MHANFEDNENYYLLLEYCDGLELFQELKTVKLKNKGGLKEETVSKLFMQLSLGVFYMQERGVIHRDLKLSNILITPSNDLKIIDLGLAV